MKNKLSQIKIGILGGGQLARMLALKSHELGLHPYILSAKKTDPAGMVTSFHVEGDLNSKKDLKKFLKLVDVVTFENEFSDTKLLQKVALETHTPIHPKPQVMGLLQDRLKQKQLLQSCKIPTAYYISGEIEKQVPNFKRLFPDGVVLKKRRAGYDGYGVCIVKNIFKDLEAQKFFSKNSGQLIAEEWIPFKKELALILIRNRKKQIVELPLVETKQESACCVWVKGPCQHKNKDSLVKKLKNLMNQIDYEGVMAFELFETKKGNLLVNELAPRVHNSGHYTLSALSEDQFSLHIKAILNLDLVEPNLHTGGFAMLNLLGSKANFPWSNKKHHPLQFYWYGKTLFRTGRKMGHVNLLDTTPNKAFNRLLKLKKDLL